MEDVIREAPIGRLARLVTGKRVLKYPEERDDFILPEAYQNLLDGNVEKSLSENSTESTPSHTATPTLHEKDGGVVEATSCSNFVSEGDEVTLESHPPAAEVIQQALDNTVSHQDVSSSVDVKETASTDNELESTMPPREEKEKTCFSINPKQANDGTILVDWYTTNDKANPQNWSSEKKAWVASIIAIYSFVVYTGSSIYISSTLGIREVYGVSDQVAALPLSLYVLAYGFGPMIFAPLTELPSVGRNPVYAVTFIIFVILSVPTSLVNSFAGLLVLRFLQGFFGSPCLANGGASMADIFSVLNTPYGLTVWVIGCFGGPAFGPLISGYVVMSHGWRWSFWEILWLTGPVCLSLVLFLPETSSPTILHQRAARLRKATGSMRFKSQSEIDHEHIKSRTVFLDAMMKPTEIAIRDPAIAFTNTYTSLIYGIYYSFFEAIPLVFPTSYGFSLGQLGLVFTCIIVACVIGAGCYVAYLYFSVNPWLRSLGPEGASMIPIEFRLRPALIAVFAIPVGLFIFGWTARADIHWIVSVIGIVIFSAGNFVILQCLSVYISRAYPKYAASLFAANDLCRSAMACGAIHFARPLYSNLGIGNGVSVLAGISIFGIGGMWVLWGYGGKMRAKSRFTSK
ncbi:hypothetical protein MMC25_007297 [Agyrium rufum]|nr:hypothetical protein [Agyrium rufum]